MPANATGVLCAILMAFYLYLLVRPDSMKDTVMYRLGLTGFLWMFAAACFGAVGLAKLTLLLTWVGIVVAFFFAVGACRGFGWFFARSGRPPSAETKEPPPPAPADEAGKENEAGDSAG